jgi:hypothetical protein
MLTKVERVAFAERRLIRSRPLLGCEENLCASFDVSCVDPECIWRLPSRESSLSSLLGPVLTAESLWHLPKASNRQDVDPCRMLADLGHEEVA